MKNEELSNIALAQKLRDQFQQHLRGRCLANEPMSSHTSFRVGGPALLYVYPRDVNDLSVLIELCREHLLNWFVAGYGTNLLVSDKGFQGVIIDLSESCRALSVDDNYIICGSGVWGQDVVHASAKAALTGLEKLAGIPGGVGGWVFMNAGAFGVSISDYLIELDVMDKFGIVHTLNRDAAGFVYRAAPGLIGKIVLNVKFLFEKGNPKNINSAIEDTIADRFRRNVMTLPSAGSVFKNPPGNFAAKLIESVNGKGLAVGGVEISQLHANFIINTRGGTSTDIIKLIKEIRNRVYEKHGIYLELELRILGFEESN